jgi:hypothetical protein
MPHENVYFMEKEITDSIRNPTYRNNPTNKAVSQARKKLGKPKRGKREPAFDETEYVQRETSESNATGVCVKNGVAMRVKPTVQKRHDDAPMLVSQEDSLTSEQRASNQLAVAVALAAEAQRKEQGRFLASRYLEDQPSSDDHLRPHTTKEEDPKEDLGQERPLFSQRSSSGGEKRPRKSSNHGHGRSKRQQHAINKSLLSFGDED